MLMILENMHVFFVCFFCQDRKASQKQRELSKAKEKQQEELHKQKQIEKVTDLIKNTVKCDILLHFTIAVFYFNVF